jgi:hypothetical protein
MAAVPTEGADKPADGAAPVPKVPAVKRIRKAVAPESKGE